MQIFLHFPIPPSPQEEEAEEDASSTTTVVVVVGRRGAELLDPPGVSKISLNETLGLRGACGWD